MQEEINSIYERYILAFESVPATKLYTKISNVTINAPLIKDAFTRFIADVECGKSFSVMDILDSAESVAKQKDAKFFAGDEIYVFDEDLLPKNRFAKRLIEKSIGNVFHLISRVEGFSIDLSAVTNLQTLRYLPIPQEKSSKLLKKAEKNNVALKKAGNILSQQKIIFTDNNSIIKSYERDFFIADECDSVSLNESHVTAFKNGYDSVLSVLLCNAINKNNIVCFPLGGDLNDAFAFALGYYSALTYHKNFPIKTLYTSNSAISVASARPKVSDGDYLYFLKLRKDFNGMTDKIHFGQLYFYLGEKKKQGIIKDVLPIRENIENVIYHLCGEDLDFETITSFPEGDFGIIVSVGRGESVNGIKLGYFRDN